MIYPSLEEFLEMEIKQKAEIIENSVFEAETPFWLTILKSSVEHNSPTPLIFSKKLMDVYREYLNHLKTK